MTPTGDVVRARIEEVRPLAAEYRREGIAQGATVEPPLPSGALFWLARTADGTPAGYAAGALHPDGLLLGPVYVRPPYRRMRMGLRLLAEIQRWAGTAQIPLVEVSVPSDNDAGVRFLEAAGYRTRRLLMARDDAAEGPS